METKIYLDTHVLMWVFMGLEKNLSVTASKIINTTKHLLVSPMSLLELDLLHELKKISQPSSVIIEELRPILDLEICSLPFHQITKTASKLSWTRDPFDRLITANAGLLDAPLITKDRTILKNYKKAIWK